MKTAALVLAGLLALGTVALLVPTTEATGCIVGADPGCAIQPRCLLYDCTCDPSGWCCGPECAPP